VNDLTKIVGMKKRFGSKEREVEREGRNKRKIRIKM
jgi:hypothetical protein